MLLWLFIWMFAAPLTCLAGVVAAALSAFRRTRRAATRLGIAAATLGVCFVVLFGVAYWQAPRATTQVTDIFPPDERRTVALWNGVGSLLGLLSGLTAIGLSMRFSRARPRSSA
jgi:hypothetical protein